MFVFLQNNWVNLNHVRRVEKIVRRNDDIKTELRLFQEVHLPPISVVSDEEIHALTSAMDAMSRGAPKHDAKPQPTKPQG